MKVSNEKPDIISPFNADAGSEPEEPNEHDPYVSRYPHWEQQEQINQLETYGDGDFDEEGRYG